jgi:hypothetical protein
MKLNYRLYFLNELYSISRSHKIFHGWAFIPLRWLQIHIIQKRKRKENWKSKAFPGQPAKKGKQCPNK